MRYFIALLLSAASFAAAAAEVSLIGTFGATAAILSIDSGAPKTVKVGQSIGGVTVISVERDRAVVETEGKRKVLIRGQGSFNASAGAGKRESVTLTAGFGGHYAAEAEVNGSPVRFLVDTGATMVALPGGDAQRLGINYRDGPAGMVQTASGTALVYRIKLDVIRVGAIELNNVDAVVIEKGLQTALLGMSFLNRVEMRHDAGRLIITRRF